MSYNVISTIINTLLIISRQYQEAEILRQLNDFFKFDHNIFLLDSSVEVDNFIPFYTELQSEYTPQSIYFFKSVDDNSLSLETVNKIKSKNTFLIVVPDNSSIKNNLKLMTLVKEIRQLKINMKIGVFFSHSVLTDNLHELFELCWKNGIVNIFAALYSENITESSFKSLLNIFTYNPFGSFKVVNVTGKSFDHFFLNKNPNFQQHTIRTAILENTWTKHSNDSLHYELANEKLWQSVFRVLNAPRQLQYRSESHDRYI